MSVSVVRLPRYFNGHSLGAVTDRIFEYWSSQNPEALVFSFADLEHIDPVAVVFFSNVLRWLTVVQGCAVHLNEFDNSKKVTSFLDSSQFIKLHCGHTLFEDSKLQDTTFPLTYITATRRHAWLEEAFIPWLSERTGVSIGALASVKTGLSEIFTNIDDHSRQDIGGTFAQHFPSRGVVVTALADFGLGIPALLRENDHQGTDAELILKAVEEGFTTKSNPNNRGAGLDTLIRYIVASLGGKVTIYSGHAIVEFDRGDKILVTSQVLSDDSFCPGTLFEITLPAAPEAYPEDEDEGDLEW